MTLTTPTPSTTAVGAPQRVSGAYALMDALHRHGVSHIFGYPGGAILPIYDELHQAEARGELKHFLVRHEQGGAHAADAYARATGKVGVCFGTSGPGATNLVTGIATAQMDSVPMVVITGQVPRPMIGTDAFQETDIFGITLPIVKHSWLVRDPADLGKPFSSRPRVGLVRSSLISPKMSAKSCLITCRWSPAASFPAASSTPPSTTSKTSVLPSI